MMNNIININKKIPYQLYQQQRNRSRRNERSNYSPNNNNINQINNNIKNPNYNNRNQNISKNNNIYYINPISNINPVNSSQNIASLKYFKSKQQNQIYLEGDLNNFSKNQTNNIYPNNSNINQNYNINNLNINSNKQKNNYIHKPINNFKQKNNRDLPRKSPLPVPKGFNTNKYINNDNLSYISKNSNNSKTTSHYTANSQLINNNYSISNLSQISGYSNNSYNNNMNIGSLINNNQNKIIRPYSSNTHSSTAQKRYNGNVNYNKQINKNLIKNKSDNNILNNQNKIKINNYINNNNINNLGNLINNIRFKKPKTIGKSPNSKPKDCLEYTVKRNMSNNHKNNYYNLINQNNNLYNNSNISNGSNISNESVLNKIGYRTSSDFSSHNNNINVYENYNDINMNPNIHMNMNTTKKKRPKTSFTRINNTKKNNNINRNPKYNNMIMINSGLNPNEINLNNYNSNETMLRQNIFFNNNMNNNYIHQYNSHNTKKTYSANISNKRNNNNDKLNLNNNSYMNNLNNLNPMVNLHIINKGQIINNNYNNVNSNNMNNNMNNLYVYKYDISQNNIIQGKYNTNTNKESSNNKIKNSLRNNNHNNINKAIGFVHAGINLTYNTLYNLNNNINIINLEKNNNINNERQNNHKFYKKGVKIRSNSSSGMGVTGELNNILNQRNYKANNLINAKKIDPTKINHKKSISNNKPINGNKIKNPNIKPIIKQIRKIHHFTHVGFNGERDKDNNQDIAFLEKNFAGNNSYLYLAVCDGHGTEGHEVSGFIKRILPKELSGALYEKDLITNDINSKKKIYNIIGQTFIKVNELLISNESINSIFSGTTCVSVIYTPLKLICANIGDSRAVLGRFDKNLKKWVAVNLSRDHKPTEEDEARRIYKKGGRIKRYRDEETGEEVGPQRVWVKDDEVPGLAMTRSFGDRVATIAGTICIPEIKEYNFNEGDKFLILASDGVWEFIQSEECINIIGKFYSSNNMEECCEYLYNESKRRWIKEEEVIDDITMLLAFFD